MQTFVVELESPVSTSFRCQKAANSLDIDTAAKSRHRLSVTADLAKPFNLGLIVGASGSGKTTLAKQLTENFIEANQIDHEKAIIDLFPAALSYDDCAELLAGMGLTSVPCWIRPFKTLSNGQQARALAALAMAQENGLCVFDEWTSVVDRTVAKAMSHCIQKFVRKKARQVILLSCHYDVIEWLNPDWIIDCNTADYVDRRSMVGTFKRTDQLRCSVAACDKVTWKAFSRYHYLSAVLPKGQIYTYGLYENHNQIGFVCFAAYIVGDQSTFFSNRLVVHPDYVGLGLGLPFVNACAQHMLDSGRATRIMAKFSSVPAQKMRLRSNSWKLLKEVCRLKIGAVGRGSTSGKGAAIRNKVRTWSWLYVGEKK